VVCAACRVRHCRAQTILRFAHFPGVPVSLPLVGDNFRNLRPSCREQILRTGCPPSRLRRFGATAFARPDDSLVSSRLAEPKLAR
jgi:hypothetical protein